MTLLVALSFAIICTIVLVRRQQRFDARPIVILGTGPMTSKLVEEVDSSNDGCRLAGLVDHQRPTDDALRSIPWLGSFDHLSEIVDRVRPSRIVVALADRRGHLPLETLLESRVSGVVVEDALEFYERLTGKIAIEALTPGTLILSKGFRHDGGQAVARAISLMVALVGLVLCAPILLLVALAIKLDSRGPVFFVQERAGWNGRPFSLLKFRTMHPPDRRRPRRSGCRTTSDRITRVGKWLRRFRLDELPQLVNVLRGEMNLIGPRPHPDEQPDDLPRAHRVLRPAVDGAARRDRLGAGALRLRQQPRRGNREDALRPLLHQEPHALARLQDPVRDRVHHGDRPRRCRSAPPGAP